MPRVYLTLLLPAVEVMGRGGSFLALFLMIFEYFWIRKFCFLVRVYILTDYYSISVPISVPILFQYLR